MENWTTSGCMLASLALIGPDVIQRAMAQLSGYFFPPVAFSFGWVAYVFEIFCLTLGCNLFMPNPEYSSIVINGLSGYFCKNHSWILDRLLNDFDYWKPDVVESQLVEILKDATTFDAAKAWMARTEPPPPRTQAGLCISVFNASSNCQAGLPATDWLYHSGQLVAIIQIGLSVISWVYHGEYETYGITVIGILLAWATGELPRWKAEKWGCPRSKKTVALTRGICTQHALVIVGGANSLDLEVLANHNPKMDLATRFFAGSLAVLWVSHLSLVLKFKGNASILMLIEGVGTFYNIFVARAPRTPESLGLPLRFKECIAEHKVMEALKRLEERYPDVGESLRGIFFSGQLSEEDRQWWAEIAAQKEARYK